MAAQAGLSIAANAFAVVGLADVVFRAGKDVVELLLKIHDTPAELSSLINSIQVLEGAIAESRSYISDLAASDFVNVDHTAVPDVVFVLQQCQQEFDRLKTVTTATAANTKDGWSLRWRKKTVFALNEKEIERSQRKLERHAQALNAIVLASEGKNQIFLRNQVSSARADIDESKNEILQRIDLTSNDFKAMVVANKDLTHQAIQASSLDLQAKLGVEGSKIDHSLQHVIATIEDSKCSTLLESKTTQKFMATASESLKLGIGTQQAMIQKSVADLALEQRHEFALVHQTQSQQNIAASQLLEELKTLKQTYGTLVHMASIEIKQTANGITEIVGLNTAELLLPLLLAESQLAKIIPSLIREGKLILSAMELKWVQSELAHLLREAISSQYGSTKEAAGGDQTAQAGTNSSNPFPPNGKGPWKASSFFPDTRNVKTVYSLNTPAGTICLSITRKVDKRAQTDSQSDDVATIVRFAFIPRLEFCNVGFTALFTRQHEKFIYHRRLRAYKILPADSQVFEIIRIEDVLVLQDMINRREVFPSDCITHRESLALESPS